MLEKPGIEELETFFLGIRILHHFVSFVDNPARVLAANDVVDAQEHIGIVSDDARHGEVLSGQRVDDTHRFHGKRAVLADVVLAELVLPVIDLDDHHLLSIR